jgi:diketogulonate reductase-like aldo/keto reductase
VVASSPPGHNDFHKPATASGAVLQTIAKRHGVSARRVALAYLVREPNVFVIPKASSAEHAADNAAAGDLVLSAEDIAKLDKAFPRGPKPRGLPML